MAGGQRQLICFNAWGQPVPSTICRTGLEFQMHFTWATLLKVTARGSAAVSVLCSNGMNEVTECVNPSPAQWCLPKAASSVRLDVQQQESYTYPYRCVCTCEFI